MGGQPVEGDLGTLGGAPVQDGLFLMIARAAAEFVKLRGAPDRIEQDERVHCK